MKRLILLLLVAIATIYVGGTYAKYTEDLSGNGTATVTATNIIITIGKNIFWNNVPIFLE